MKINKNEIEMIKINKSKLRVIYSKKVPSIERSSININSLFR